MGWIPGGGGGGYSRFQVTGMIEWGQKSKPKKFPRASNKTPKNPNLNLRLNQATQKNICQIFLPKKNPGIENCKRKKIILRSLPSLVIRSTPTSSPRGGGGGLDLTTFWKVKMRANCDADFKGTIKQLTPVKASNSFDANQKYLWHRQSLIWQRLVPPSVKETLLSLTKSSKKVLPLLTSKNQNK